MRSETIYGLAMMIFIGPLLLSAQPAQAQSNRAVLLPVLERARPTDAGELAPQFPPKTVILFQGHSITDGGRGRGPNPNHILGQDYAYLIAAGGGGHDPDQGWVFYNRGISGNKVTDLASRWQNDTLALKPDILSILIGVNDAASVVNDADGGGVSAQQYEQVYDGLLPQAVAANPSVKLVLCEPFIEPVGHVQEHPVRWSAEIKARQSAVERLATKYHAPVVHFQTALDDAVKHSHQPVTYWVWDGIHPTYAGHQVMADEWLRTVNRFYYRMPAAQRKGQ